MSQKIDSSTFSRLMALYTMMYRGAHKGERDNARTLFLKLIEKNELSEERFNAFVECNHKDKVLHPVESAGKASSGANPFMRAYEEAVKRKAEAMARYREYQERKAAQEKERKEKERLSMLQRQNTLEALLSRLRMAKAETGQFDASIKVGLSLAEFQILENLLDREIESLDYDRHSCNEWGYAEEDM